MIGMHGGVSPRDARPPVPPSEPPLEVTPRRPPPQRRLAGTGRNGADRLALRRAGWHRRRLRRCRPDDASSRGRPGLPELTVIETVVVREPTCFPIPGLLSFRAKLPGPVGGSGTPADPPRPPAEWDGQGPEPTCAAFGLACRLGPAHRPAPRPASGNPPDRTTRRSWATERRRPSSTAAKPSAPSCAPAPAWRRCSSPRPPAGSPRPPPHPRLAPPAACPVTTRAAHHLA